MKRRVFLGLSIATLVLAALAWAGWNFGPGEGIRAVAALSDPAHLATLGPRGANPRVNKLVYWLHVCERHGASPSIALSCAFYLNKTTEPRRTFSKEALLRNMKIARELGLFTTENEELLRRGHSGHITRGPYKGSTVEVDHIVPYSLAPELGNELGNLELMPRELNRQKSNHVGDRQLALAARFQEAGMLSKEKYELLKAFNAHPQHRREAAQ